MTSFHTFAKSTGTHTCDAWTDRFHFAIVLLLLSSILSKLEDHASILISYLRIASLIASLFNSQYHFFPSFLITRFPCRFSNVYCRNLYASLAIDSSKCLFISSITVFVSNILTLIPVAVCVIPCSDLGVLTSIVNVLAWICLSISFCSWKYSQGICLCGNSTRFCNACCAGCDVGIMFHGADVSFLGSIQLLGLHTHVLFNALLMY